jgi:hypothetical protein
MSSQAFDMVPIQNENDGKVLGVLTEGTFALTPLYLLLSVLSFSVQPCPNFFVDSFISLSQSYFSSLFLNHTSYTSHPSLLYSLPPCLAIFSSFLSPHTPPYRESDEHDDPGAHPTRGNVCWRHVQTVPPSPAVHFSV